MSGTTTPVYTSIFVGVPVVEPIEVVTVITFCPWLVVTFKLCAEPGAPVTLFVSAPATVAVTSGAVIGLPKYVSSGILKVTVAFSAPLSPRTAESSVTAAGESVPISDFVIFISLTLIPVSTPISYLREVA